MLKILIDFPILPFPLPLHHYTKLKEIVILFIPYNYNNSM